MQPVHFKKIAYNGSLAFKKFIDVNLHIIKALTKFKRCKMIEDIKKLLEKQNFLILLKYTTSEEIGKTSGTGKRLLDKYSGEVRRINSSAFLYNAILRHQVKYKL